MIKTRILKQNNKLYFINTLRFLLLETLRMFAVWNWFRDLETNN